MLSPAAYKARLQAVSEETQRHALSRWFQPVLDCIPAEPSTKAMLQAMAALLAECYPDLISKVPEDVLAELQAEFTLFAKKAAQPNAVYRHIDLGMADGFCREELAILSCLLAFRAAPTLRDLVNRDMSTRDYGIHTPENVRNILDELGSGKGEQPSHFDFLYDSLQVFESTISSLNGYGSAPAILSDAITLAVLNQMIGLRRNGADFCTLPNPSDPDYFEKLGKRLDAYRAATHGQINPLDVTGTITNKPVRIRCGFFTITANSLTTSVEGVNERYLSDLHAALHRFEHALQLAELLPDCVIDYDRQTRMNINVIDKTLAKAQGMDAEAILTIATEIVARESNAQAKSQIGAYLQLCRNYEGYVRGGIGQTAADNRIRLLHWPDIHVGAYGVEEDHAKSAIALLQLFMDSSQAPNPRHAIAALRTCREKGFLFLQHELMDSIAETMADARKRAQKAQKGQWLFIPPQPLRSAPQNLHERLRRLAVSHQLG